MRINTVAIGPIPLEVVTELEESSGTSHEQQMGGNRFAACSDRPSLRTTPATRLTRL